MSIVLWLGAGLLLRAGEPVDLSRLPEASEGSVTPAGSFVPRQLDGAAAAVEPGTALIVRSGPASFLVAGRIVVDRDARSVTLPATVNMVRGQVEYLLVSASGKRHEAVFRTQVHPEHLHAACLLLGLPVPSVPLVDADQASGLSLEMVWHRHGPPARIPVDTLLRPAAAGAPSLHAGWIYNGSRFTGAGFSAQLEGSFIALIPDPSALINGLGLPAGILIPDEALLPPVGTPVSLVLHFPDRVVPAAGPAKATP